MKCRKVIEASSVLIKRSNVLKKHPVCSFQHATFITMTSDVSALLWYKKEKTAFSFPLNVFFYKTLRRQFIGIIFFPNFQIFFALLLSIFFLTCLLHVRKLMRWRKGVSRHERNLLLLFAFLSENVDGFYVSLLKSATLCLHVIWMRPWSNTSWRCLMPLCLYLRAASRKID